MARKYNRDARGRFSGGGGGATARGGRLKTASGKKRPTVTAKVGGGGPKGTIGKKRGAAAGKAKPANSIKPLKRQSAQNNIRKFKPATTKGAARKVNRILDSTPNANPSSKPFKLDRSKIKDAQIETRIANNFRRGTRQSGVTKNAAISKKGRKSVETANRATAWLQRKRSFRRR